MRDEDLRDEFDLLLWPIREAAPPGMPVIRHRLRRRRTRMAAATGAAAVAVGVVVGIAVTVSAPQAPPASSQIPVSTHPSENTITSAQPRLGPDGWQESASYGISALVRNIIVSDDVGSVTIVGSDRPSISVTEQVTGMPVQPQMARSVTGGTLTLTYTCQGQSDCSVNNCDNCGVNYVIQAPAGTAINVSDDLGTVDISGLTGPVTATDSEGKIEATDLASGSVDLTDDLGNITADCVTPPATLRVSDSEGNIGIAVPAGLSYHVSTTDSLGSVSVNVPQSNAAPHSIVAQDDLGNITISPDR
jgi:hypothetical protein